VRPALLVLALLALSGAALAGEDFSFDISALEPKPWTVQGYFELQPSFTSPDPDSLLRRLKLFDKEGVDSRTQMLARLQLEAVYRRGDTRLYLRTNSDLQRELGEWDHLTSLHEGYVSWTPRIGLALDAGKKVMRWGTGYSWSPVAFIERPKDPDDPELPREGFFLLAAERVTARPAALQTVGMTLVLLPVASDVGSDFGDEPGLNAAGKLYLLYADTDIDILALAGPSQPTRFGFDFARNLEPHFEVHGEYAYAPAEDRSWATAEGEVLTARGPVHRGLLGLRYLTPSETTYIVEYQHNGAGASASEIEDFFDFVSAADAHFRETGDDSLLQRARWLNQELYSERPLGRHYLYARVSHREPWSILYLTAATTLQCNLSDGSFSLIPEATYARHDDWEMRVRAALLVGADRSEFGEKPGRYRFDLRLRRLF
jgi:hypothetical protein